MAHNDTLSADQILDLTDESQVHGLVASLVKERALSPVVKDLNEQVLRGAEPDRAKAVAALKRLGLWTD